MTYKLDDIIERVSALLLFTVSVATVLYFQSQIRTAVSVLISGLAVSVIGIFFVLTSFEKSGFPLQAVLPILLLEPLKPFSSVSSTASKTVYFSTLLWAISLIATAIVPNALGLVYGVEKTVRFQHRGYDAMHSPALNEFLPTEGDEFYLVLVNDGITLLNQLRLPKDTVLSLDFANPFSYGLGMIPARGGAIALQYGTTFDDLHKPSADRLFGNSTLVMMPKDAFYSDDTLTESIPRLYGPYLVEHFRLVGESRRWKLYRRRIVGQ